ncbi:MAG: thiol:disulfide interchange protein DsbA/DsbL [Burkholderiaceae bacterium]
MKRRDFSIAALASATTGMTSAQGAAPVAGKDYLILDKPVATEAKGKLEVVEFFWYSCPHCNAFEPTLANWLKALPKDVDFKRAPVRFRESFEPQQKVYYVLEALKKLETHHAKLFYAIHVEKQNLASGDAIVTWAEKNGLDRKAFMDLFNSFTISGKARQAAQLQEAFNVEGVPALGVAGRFYTDGSLAGSMEKALQVVNYLLAEVRKGK